LGSLNLQDAVTSTRSSNEKREKAFIRDFGPSKLNFFELSYNIWMVILPELDEDLSILIKASGHWFY